MADNRMRQITVLLLLSLALGCARSTSPTTTGSANPAKASQQSSAAATSPKVPDFAYTALAPSDVDLYLSIMREAAQRREHLSAQDQDVLAAERDYYMHLKSGKQPDPTPAQAKMLTRANAIHYLDNEVAKEKGKLAYYSAVREAIEGMVGPTKCTNSDCGTEVPEADPALREQQLNQEAQRKKIIGEDLPLLQPHEAEITRLVTELREIARQSPQKSK